MTEAGLVQAAHLRLQSDHWQQLLQYINLPASNLPYVTKLSLYTASHADS